MRTKLALVVAFGSILSVAPAYSYSGKIAFKGSEAGSYVNTGFSFDGGEDGIDTVYGVDTLGGPHLAQSVSEYYDSGDSCTASDGTIGELFDLSEALAIITYFNGGQIYLYSDDGTQCISLTTGVQKGSLDFYIIGGSGKFTGASGSGSTYFTGVELAAPSYPGSGFFGQVQDVFSGTVTP
jgi:hypothetical protein